MTKGSPYRRAEESLRAPATPPELIYQPRDGELYAEPMRIILQGILLAGAAVIAAGLLGYPGLGAIVALAWIGHTVLRVRRASEIEGLLLRIRGGELQVWTRRSEKQLLLAIPLENLLDVELDTKSIQKGRRDTRVAVAILADGIRTTVDPAVDVARIVLVPQEPRAPVVLTNAYLSHMEAVDGASKIRVFLRAHGWVPEDEREVGPAP